LPSTVVQTNNNLGRYSIPNSKQNDYFNYTEKLTFNSVFDVFDRCLLTAKFLSFARVGEKRGRRKSVNNIPSRDISPTTSLQRG